MRASVLIIASALMAFAASAAEPGLPPVFVPAKLIKQVDVRPPKFGRLGFRASTIRACFTITDEGKVKDITYPEYRDDAFESAIKHALVRWRYEPATLDGKPVASSGCADVQFRAIGG